LSKTNLGYIYVALASFFFALTSIIGKSAFNTGVTVYDLMIMQNVVSVLVMLGYLLITDKKSILLSKDKLKNVIIQGIFGSTAATVFFYLAVEKMNAGIAAMLIFTHPVFVTLFFVLTGMRKITWVNNLALFLTVLGSALVINVFNLDVAKTPAIGIVYGILGSVACAFFNIFADLRLKDIKPEVVPLYTSTVMLIISAMINPGFFRFDITLSPQTVFYVFELAIVSGVLPVIFLYKGIALVGSEKVTIIATTELPVTVLLAFLILKETMVFTQIIGVVTIIGAVLVLHREPIILQKINAWQRDKTSLQQKMQEIAEELHEDPSDV